MSVIDQLVDEGELTQDEADEIGQETSRTHRAFDDMLVELGCSTPPTLSRCPSGPGQRGLRRTRPCARREA
jgi:hypothetical protein